MPTLMINDPVRIDTITIPAVASSMLHVVMETSLIVDTVSSERRTFKCAVF